MKLRDALKVEQLRSYGTSEGVKKAWDSRGRGGSAYDEGQQAADHEAGRSALKKAGWKLLSTEGGEKGGSPHTWMTFGKTGSDGEDHVVSLDKYGEWDHRSNKGGKSDTKPYASRGYGKGRNLGKYLAKRGLDK